MVQHRKRFDGPHHDFQSGGGIGVNHNFTTGQSMPQSLENPYHASFHNTPGMGGNVSNKDFYNSNPSEV